MAYDYFAEQDQEEDSQKQQQETGMVALGPEGTTIKDQPSQQQAPGAEGTNSGSFTNLNSYLDANKSLGFGGQVAGKVQGEVDQAGEAQKTADSTFRQQADAGSVSFDPSLGAQVAQDATAVVGDQGKFSDFLKARDAEYKGPNNLVDSDAFQATDAAQRKAQEAAQASGSEGGRMALLDQYYGTGNGRNDYTGGQKKLENLLIQNDTASRDAFAKTTENAAKTAQDYGSLKDTLSAYGGAQRAATGQARAQARAAIGIDDAGNEVAGQGAIGALKTGVKSAADKRLADRETERTTVAQALRDRKLASLDPKYRGVVGDIGSMQLYGADPTQYLRDTGTINEQTVATKQQQAQMAALAKLAGKENTYLPDEALAGTMDDEALTSFDAQTLRGEAEGRAARYNDVVNTKNRAWTSGGYNPDTGESTGGGMRSLLEDLETYGKSAEWNRAVRSGDTFAETKYNEALAALQKAQEEAGYNDTFDGATPGGSYRNYKTY